jgi:hypothetical protein
MSTGPQAPLTLPIAGIYHPNGSQAGSRASTTNGCNQRRLVAFRGMPYHVMEWIGCIDSKKPPKARVHTPVAYSVNLAEHQASEERGVSGRGRVCQPVGLCNWHSTPQRYRWQCANACPSHWYADNWSKTALSMTMLLAGMPELRLGLNDKVLFESSGRREFSLGLACAGLSSVVSYPARCLDQPRMTWS